MALKLAGEEIGIQERFEALTYSPGLPNSGDMEAATKTVTATSKPASPDYTTNLTVASPPAKLKVRRLGLRLQVTIDSFGGSPAATQLNYSVAVNGTERLSGSWTSIGGQFGVVDLTEGQFNLGSSNQIKIYLWVNQGNAVVSICQVWLGVGTTTTGYLFPVIITIDHYGFINGFIAIVRTGTGSFETRLRPIDGSSNSYYVLATNGSLIEVPLLVLRQGAIGINTLVATDLVIVHRCEFVIRSVE